MGATSVPSQAPGQDSFYYVFQTSPFDNVWWTSQTLTQIPDEAVGWLVAQGWNITGVTYDTAYSPPEPRFAMSRQSLQNWKILEGMIDHWVTNVNEANGTNAVRYNDTVESWTSLINTSYTHFDVMTAEQNTQSATFLANLSTYMDDVNTTTDSNQTAFVSDMGDAETALTALDAATADFATNLSTYITDITGKLESLDADYVSHTAEITSLISGSDTNYTLHESTAEAFLTDLGTTELARINEEFAASLAQQLQQLTDRGMYSAGIAADITARSNRDRSERITELNDRLAREKLQNEHTLYDQLVQKDRWQASQRDTLWAQLVALEQQNIAGYDSQLAARNGATSALIQGKATYASSTVQMGSTLAEHQHRVVTEKMTEYNARLSGIQVWHDSNMKLMEYQLGARNELMVGLYGFVERREDVAPQFDSLVQIATALGDAGGGWVTP